MNELKHFKNNEDKWMLGEHIPNADLFFSTIWLSGFVDSFSKHINVAYKKILCKYEGYNLWFYYGDKDSYEVGENLTQKILNEHGFAKKVNDNIIIQSDRLYAFSETIPQDKEVLKKLSDAEVWEIYRMHQEIHEEYYTWGWIPVCADMFHGNLTGYVKEYLTSVGVPEEKLNEVFVDITQSDTESLIMIEQDELLDIAISIEKNSDRLSDWINLDAIELEKNLNEDEKKRLTKHWEKYYYTKHLWVSGEYTILDYITQLKDVIISGELPSVVKEKQIRKFKESIEKRKQLLETYNVDEKWRAILDAYADFMVTKIYRRYAQLLAVHHMSPVLKEIARRKHITEKQVRFTTVAEMKEMLLNDTYNEAELLERTKMSVYYAEKGGSKVFIGEEAEEVCKSLETKIDTNISELSGDIGCAGYGKGEVKIIIRAEDMKKMNEGDILVSIATDPDIVPAMKKASAIVTEQGGVTSHAAIVARELGIPCVIGTKIATKVFKDGDIVEVDAQKGIVKKMD